MILVSKFMIHRVLNDKIYLSSELLYPLIYMLEMREKKVIKLKGYTYKITHIEAAKIHRLPYLLLT